MVSEKIASAQSRQARQGDEVTQQCKPLCYLCLPVPSSKGIHTRSRCSTMDLCPCVALLHQSPCCFHCGSIIGDSEFHAMPCCCCCCRPCSCSDHARHDSNSMHTLMPRCRFSSLLSFHACTSCRENFPRVFSSSLLHQPNLLTSAAVSSQGYGHRQ